ncbi:MAG: lysine--tRNA ligase [Cytophagales bacterium]|nr:lysine--tRNA ligase [Cytophagales bacterium]
MGLSEQEELRHVARRELLGRGIDPYPADSFPLTGLSSDLSRRFEEDPSSCANVSLAGRIRSRRIMGAASFVELQDSGGRIQLYLKRDDICSGSDKSFYNEIFKRYMDIGDLIGVQGSMFRTQRGEITLRVRSLKLLCKSLRPLPVVKESSSDGDGDGSKIYDAFSDPEQRYRQRYVDLILNSQVREIFVQRTKLVQVIRNFLNGRKYLEVETPILQALWGGATARPFITHHHVLKTDLYLRIANELYLKRLIVGGFDGVYEFSKDFRNEGMSRFHNPEFTQMELYVAYKDYYWMAELTENLIGEVLRVLHGSTRIQVGDREIDFSSPWRRVHFYDLLEEKTGESLRGSGNKDLERLAKKWDLSVPSHASKAKLLDMLFSHLCEPNLIEPTFVLNHPVELSPLAKKHREEEGVVERFELICNGKEICNAYSELNDPVEQRIRFQQQLDLAKKGDVEAMAMDEDFLRALSYGMPPTSGLGIGIDRLAMLMTNSSSIQDVLFFPQMRPESSGKPKNI